MGKGLNGVRITRSGIKIRYTCNKNPSVYTITSATYTLLRKYYSRRFSTSVQVGYLRPQVATSGEYFGL